MKKAYIDVSKLEEDIKIVDGRCDQALSEHDFGTGMKLAPVAIALKIIRDSLIEE